MLKLFKNLFSTDNQPEETIRIPEIIARIKQKESEQNIPLGRRIHTFNYKDVELSLDRDITENYRVTVYQGRERIYSFSIFANQGNYDILENGYIRIINFLDGERKVSDLPEEENIKGFFYGH